MPVIFRYKGYRFFFFSNEGDPLEPVHVHVQKVEKIAKFWLTENEVVLAESYGLKSSELTELVRAVEQNTNMIMERWNEYFNS